MKKLLFIATLLLMVCTSAKAQGLKVGDKVPEFTIKKIINYPVKSLKFSDIKPRLVILDFWTTYCSSCIAALPEMDKLQKKFGKEILILPVTFETEERVRPFWVKSKYASATSLPTVVNDTLLDNYFPHQGVPFEVWLLDGKVFAFTNSLKVNEQEIAEVLSGKPKDWAMAMSMLKKDEGFKLPLLKLNFKATDTTLTPFYSTITPVKPLVLGQLKHNLSDTNRSRTELKMTNAAIINLYHSAFFLDNDLNKETPFLGQRSRTIMEVADISKFYNSEQQNIEEWNRAHSFCYETILPGKVSAKDLSGYMLADLDKFFGLWSRIEKRNVDCWILSLQPGITRIEDAVSKSYSKNERKVKERTAAVYKTNSEAELMKFNDERTEASNDRYYKMDYVDDLLKSVSEILEAVNMKNEISSGILNEPLNPPLIDETGYAAKFKLTLNLANSHLRKITFEELQKELNKHGFDLKKGIREMGMLVMTEKRYKSSLFTAIAQTTPQFTLQGQLEGLKDGMKVYLVKEKSANRKQLDTVGAELSKGGKFSFKGVVKDRVGFYNLQTDGATAMTQKLVFVNADMKLTGDWKTWPRVELSGSEPHVQYLEILKMNAEMNAGLKAEKADMATAKLRKVSVFTAYINSHLKGLLTPFLIDQLIGISDVSELRRLYDALGQEAKNGSFGLSLARKLEKAERFAAIKVGSTIPDFNLTMADGQVVSVKSLAAKNKITLVDFWASWCKPCRMEIPNLREVYNTYHEKGFGILGISSDAKAELWRKALEEDKTPWLQGLDTEFAGKNIFDIRAIPSYMMIDQNGKIVSLELLSPVKGGGLPLRGKVLHETVKKLLEEKEK